MTDLLQIWAMAEASTLGIRVKTDDPVLLRQQLYRARAETDQYRDIVIVVPNIEGQLWLVHRDADEGRGFDTIHAQPVHQGSGIPPAQVRGPGGEQGDQGDTAELGEGEEK